MATKVTKRLNKRTLDTLVKSGVRDSDVWDDQLKGYHVRVRKADLSFRVSYYNQSGKRRNVTLGKYSVLPADKARQAALEVLTCVGQGNDPMEVSKASTGDVEAPTTLREYLQGPYKVAQDRRKDGKGTLRRIEKDFQCWLGTPLVKIDREAVEKWQADEESKKKPRAFLTLKRSYDSLNALMVHATERKVIEKNPLEGVKLQKPALSEKELINKSKRRHLEPDEVTALFKGLEAYQDVKREQRMSSIGHGKGYLPNLSNVTYVDHVKPMVLLLYYTGFRLGDMLGLRWEHVDLKQETIRKVIEKTAHHNPEPLTFPISKAAVRVLEDWRNQHKKIQGYVFQSHITGNRLDNGALRRPWNLIKKLANLPDDLVLYSLRHNFASQLVMGGVDLLTVSKLMAHTDIQTTVKHYAHLKPDNARRAVELL